MISTLEKEITFRFLKARKKDGFLNVISIFSFIGISLGVAVLIIVMSVMNGFRTELINKIVGFNSHITIQPYEESININNIENSSLEIISKNLILSNSSEAIIIGEQFSKGILLRGYLENDFSKLELINAFKELKKNKETINEKNLKRYLQTKDIPDPDLLIRTGNTKRLSNFLLWQLSYTEIFFSKKLWPEFTENDYINIINKYRLIKRNFGKI